MSPLESKTDKSKKRVLRNIAHPPPSSEPPEDFEAGLRIGRAADAFMVLFRDPAREIRKKSEREILRVIRYAVNNRRSWVLATMHSGFCAALNSINGCGVDRSMEFLRKEMDSRDVKTTPPAGFKSWPVTAKQLKRFVERHSGHRYPETMILIVAKAKGVPIKQKAKKRPKAAKKAMKR